MATPHELFIFQSQDRIVAAQEVRAENDLDTVVVTIEQLNAPNLVQDRISMVAHHVVCVVMGGSELRFKA